MELFKILVQMAKEKTDLSFNSGIILCRTNPDLKCHTCTVYFSNWYTLMDFYTKTLKDSNISAIIYTHPIQYSTKIHEKLKTPYLKTTKKTIHFYNNTENIYNIFMDGSVHISFVVKNSSDFIKVMQKIKEYCYECKFYTFYREGIDKLVGKLTIFDGLDDELRPIYKEIKTEGII